MVLLEMPPWQVKQSKSGCAGVRPQLRLTSNRLAMWDGVHGDNQAGLEASYAILHGRWSSTSTTMFPLSFFAALPEVYQPDQKTLLTDLFEWLVPGCLKTLQL